MQRRQRPMSRAVAFYDLCQDVDEEHRCVLRTLSRRLAEAVELPRPDRVLSTVHYAINTAPEALQQEIAIERERLRALHDATKFDLPLLDIIQEYAYPASAEKNPPCDECYEVSARTPENPTQAQEWEWGRKYKHTKCIAALRLEPLPEHPFADDICLMMTNPPDEDDMYCSHALCAYSHDIHASEEENANQQEEAMQQQEADDMVFERVASEAREEESEDYDNAVPAPWEHDDAVMERLASEDSDDDSEYSGDYLTGRKRSRLL